MSEWPRVPHHLRLAIGLTVVLAATPPGLHAQQVIGPPTCKACSIEVVGRMPFGALEDSVGLASLPRGLVRPDGVVLLVSDVPSASGALMYRPSGELLGILGRPGEGPGEMRQALRIAQGDSATFVQAVDRQIHVFGPDGTFRTVVRGVPLPVRNLLASGDSLLVVVSGSRRPRAAPDRAVHLYDARTGEHLRAVGPVLDLDPRTSPPIIDAAVGEQGIWVLLPPSRIELWTGKGMSRRLDWDEDWLTTVDRFYRHGASDAVVDMQAWEDRITHRLWVMTIVHQPRSSAPDSQRRGPGGAMSPDAFGPSSLQRVFNTVISVIDLDSGTVLAHEELDEAAVQFLNDGRLLVAMDDSRGYLWAEAWELRLRAR